MQSFWYLAQMMHVCSNDRVIILLSVIPLEREKTSYNPRYCGPNLDRNEVLRSAAAVVTVNLERDCRSPKARLSLIILRKFNLNLWVNTKSKKKYIFHFTNYSININDVHEINFNIKFYQLL